MTRVLSALPVTAPVVVPVVALVVSLSGCSGGSGPSTVAADALAGAPAASSGTVPSSASSSVPSSVPSSAAAAPGAGPSRDGGTGTADAEVTGWLSPLGTGAIVVDTGRSVREVRLAAGTVVLDAQGSVCDEGEAPHRCSSEQLVTALKAGVAFRATVSIGDGTAVRIEEVVRE
ncbi:hypothetical protein [Streptosporangium sp. NPDC051022]|uniref:hypothetical protein n=1 Tax=Streptosporangium sp. NPDC051022 TaxID=3155752 RepID=UPI0034258F62